MMDSKTKQNDISYGAARLFKAIMDRNRQMAQMRKKAINRRMEQMHRTLTEQEKYDLAKKLDAVQGVLYAVTELDVPEDLIDALDDAIEYLSPRYVEDCMQELEDGMNSPEAKAFAARVMEQQGENIIDFKSRKGGKK